MHNILYIFMYAIHVNYQYQIELKLEKYSTFQKGIIFNVHWRDRRRFALSSMRDFGLGKKSLDERMREEAGFLVKEIDRTEGKPRDLTQLLPFVTGNIICSIIFGDRFVRFNFRPTRILQQLLSWKVFSM